MGLQRSDYLGRAKAPDGKREVQYPSPNVSNLVVVESVPISPDSYKALPYGSPHESYDTTGLVLVRQRQIKATDNQIWVTRVYASRNINEDWYDYTLRYAGDVIANPIFIRSYHKLRNEFVPVARGTPFKGVYRMIVTANGANYTSPPTAVFTGANTTPASANAIMSPPDDSGNMTVIGLELTDEGDGYTTAPTIVFTGGGGSGATATAYIQPAAAILIKEELVELENESPDLASLFVKVTRVYETLPGPLFISSEYDDEKIYGERNRGAVLKTIQAIFAVGNEVASFDRPSSGQARKTWYEPRGESAIVLNKTIETWTEIQIHDQAMTEEFFGGILNVDKTRAAVGAQTPDTGFLVTESDLATISPDEQIKTSKQLDGEEWSEVVGEKVITEGLFTGVRIEVRKQYVPVATSNPHPDPFSSNPPTFTEFVEHDIWRKLQITSKILSYPTFALVYYSTEEVHLPSKLTSADHDWTTEGHVGASSHVSLDNTVAQSSADGSAEVIPVVKILADAGFRGAARSRITRTYFLMTTEGVGPGTGIVPIPEQIVPVNGVAILVGRKLTGSSTLGNVNNENSAGGGIIREIREFGPFLTSGLSVSDSHAIGTSNLGYDVSATAGPKTGEWQAAMISAGGDATVEITVPASTPTELVTGVYYVWKVNVIEGPMGLFVIEVIEIQAP